MKRLGQAGGGPGAPPFELLSALTASGLLAKIVNRSHTDASDYTLASESRMLGEMAADTRGEQPKHCPLEATCPMYDMFQLSGTQELWQAFYCHQDFERCARLQMTRRGQVVPLALLPDGKLLRSSRKPPPP